MQAHRSLLQSRKLRLSKGRKTVLDRRRVANTDSQVGSKGLVGHSGGHPLTKVTSTDVFPSAKCSFTTRPDLILSGRAKRRADGLSRYFEAEEVTFRATLFYAPARVIRSGA